MSTLAELEPLPPITVALELFDYVPLGSPRKPPPIEVRACLARSYEADEGKGEDLRLAFVAGRPVDSYDLLVLAYVWRAPPRGVAWAVERWSSPERALRLYRRDPTFEPAPAVAIHEELRTRGAASVAAYARRVLSTKP